MARYHYTSYYDYLQYYLSDFPIYFFFFLAILLFFLFFTWYINYDSMLEDLMDQARICLVVFPVLLLLAVHWLSSDHRERVPFAISFPEKESLHRVGGSPVGVAVLLIFLLFMISHRSSLQERWFPLFSRK